MAAIPWWYDVQKDGSNPWDTVALGVFVLPGLSRVDVARGVNLGIMTAPGQDGARVVNTGRNPAKFDIVTTFWLPEHWAAMQDIIRALEPSAALTRGGTATGPTQFYGRKPYSYSIAHPVTQVRGINSVLIEQIVGPHPASVVGAMEVVFKVVENLKPLVAPVQSKGLDLPPRNSATTGSVLPPSTTKKPTP